MMVLVREILIGISVALALSVLIGLGLAKLLATAPPWLRVKSRVPFGAAQNNSHLTGVAVVRLDSGSERIMARLIGDLDKVRAVILRAAELKQADRCPDAYRRV